MIGSDPGGPAPGRPIVIAGGGTAGHVTPALAIADALVDRGVPAERIVFVGSRRGIEARLVPQEGFRVVLLPGRGIERRISVRAVAAALSILAGVVRGLALLLRLRPAAVVSVGGYASVPCAVGAVLFRIPLVVHEQNAVPSASNRLVGRFAKACAVSFPSTGLPHEVVTGNPLRRALVDALRAPDRLESRRDLGVPDGARLVVVTGGSLGARRVNEAAVDALAAWAGRDDLAVHHITGVRDHAAVIARRPEAGGGPWYRVVEYEERMAVVYAAADLAVCRAGATTVAELAVAGLPAVLVPLPIAPNDAQGRNAAAVAATGGGVVVRDADLTGARLAALVDELLADPERLDRMRAGIATLARPAAAGAVAALVAEHARG